MKLLLAICFTFLAAVTLGQQATDQPVLEDQLLSYGTGVVLVPIDRAAITITASGTANAASDAVKSARDLQSRINDTLQNYTLLDIRNGGLYLQPLYSASSLSFAVSTSLTIVTKAVDMPAIIDSMVSLGASNISFIFTPDFYAVELAQRQSLQLAVADALFKAQAVLDTIKHCALNITNIAIRNPASNLPSLTFNIFANMGRLNNNLYNLNNNNNNNQNLNNNNNNQNNNNNLNNNNINNGSPMMLGGAAPLLEGDREEVVSYVEVSLRHVSCATGGSGIIQDITSSLDLSNLPGIAGGSLTQGSPISSPISSEIGSGSSGLSGSGSALNMRRNTMW